MKRLSEFTGDAAIDVVADLFPYLAEIARNRRHQGHSGPAERGAGGGIHLHRRQPYQRRSHSGDRPRPDGAFWAAEQDPGLVWLCVGDYRGPRRVSTFVQYLLARMEKQAHEALYRVYMTDCVKLAVENTAGLTGGHVVTTRYAELVAQATGTSRDERTGDEIAAEVIAKAGLEVVRKSGPVQSTGDGVA